MEVWLQGLGCARAAQRDFEGRDALDPPAAYGVAFRDLQRLVAADRENCEAVAGRRNDPGQPRIGEIVSRGSAGSILRRPPRAAEERSSESCGNQLLGSRVLRPTYRARGTGLRRLR